MSTRVRAHQAQLEIGDRLYLYTDGVVEAANCDDDQFGYDRLREAIEEARELSLDESVQYILRQVDDWCGECPIDDDVSVLALQRTPLFSL